MPSLWKTTPPPMLGTHSGCPSRAYVVLEGGPNFGPPSGRRSVLQKDLLEASLVGGSRFRGAVGVGRIDNGKDDLSRTGTFPWRVAMRAHSRGGLPVQPACRACMMQAHSRGGSPGGHISVAGRQAGTFPWRVAMRAHFRGGSPGGHISVAGWPLGQPGRGKCQGSILASIHP